MTPKRPPRAPRPPLQWAGILFALAAAVFVVNIAQRLVTAMAWSLPYEAIATLLAPLIVGIATGFYTRTRGAIHAFIGGVLSIPILALGAFGGNWQLATLAACSCAAGGVVSELYLRMRNPAGK